jgi:putative transcriptional regulator
MININAGQLLISAPTLDDPSFNKVVIFIAEQNAKGALGFVVNRLFHRTFNELMEYRHSLPFKLYEGGPVENESLYFLHQQPHLIEGGTHIVDSIYLGGDFKQAVQLINNKTIKESELKLFIGYCGWDYGELEDEVKEGSWLVGNNTSEIVFTTDISPLWENLYVQRR